MKQKKKKAKKRGTRKRKREFIQYLIHGDGNIGIFFFRFTICLHVMLYSQVLVHILCVVPNSVLLHSQSSQKFCDFHSLCLFSRLETSCTKQLPEKKFLNCFMPCFILKCSKNIVRKNIFIDLRLRMRKSSARATHTHTATCVCLPLTRFSFSHKLFLFIEKHFLTCVTVCVSVVVHFRGTAALMYICVR